MRTMDRMRTILLVLVLALALAACAPSPAVAPAPSREEATPPSAPVATPETTAQPSVLPTLPDPTVALSPDPFPIEPTLALRSSLAADDVARARGGVELYLMSLNSYRNNDNAGGGIEAVPAGPFREAVRQGLQDSATPGVKRKLELESIRVDRLIVKPWGTPALAEVTATIVDRVVEGPGEDQREVGRLRLTGERLRVSDAWDYANGRWFNGGGSAGPKADAVREAVVPPLSFYLRLEQWLPGSPAETWRAGEPTPFSAARAQRLAAIDRSQIVSRSFDGVRAKIERYETFAEIPSGIATVRLSGIVVTGNAGGQTTRTSFDRIVKVFLFGGWLPEVVDEAISPGVWLSGGDLALQLVDVNRA